MKGTYRFEYLYRDASNYKVFNSVVLTGEVVPGLERNLQAKFKSGIYFVPEQLCVPPLQQEMAKYSDTFPTEDDHVWHESVGLSYISGEPISDDEIVVPVEQFVSAVASIEKWDETASHIYEKLCRLGYC